MKDKIKNIVKENLRFIITVVIIIAVFTIELPFKVYTPGGMIDLNSRVSVDNAFESKGSFGMAYVSVIKGTVPYLALSYLIPNWDIVSDDHIKNPNETMAEKEKIDKLNTEESIGNAIISAHNLAKKKVELKSTHSYISYIDELSDTNAELLDEVLEINGHEAKGLESLKKIVETLKEGDEVKLKVKREEKIIECYAKVFMVDNTPKIGMSVVETYDYETESNAHITMKSTESGPSGGLMMSLAVYNSLVPDDITKGFNIIGTGTIDKDGNVGAIGGVKYKLLGAVKKKAYAFLVPKDNYEEAMKVKEENNLDIIIISVKSLEDAINQLSVLD